MYPSYGLIIIQGSLKINISSLPCPHFTYYLFSNSFISFSYTSYIFYKFLLVLHIFPVLFTPFFQKLSRAIYMNLF